VTDYANIFATFDTFIEWGIVVAKVTVAKVLCVVFLREREDFEH
jgi:hypothetical protein